jgi:hypothetical protein
MTNLSPGFDPERRPTLFQSIGRLPWLLYRVARWHGLRGGWLPDYLLYHRRFDRSRIPDDRPIDIMVLFSDHFEPARRFGDQAAIDSVRSWCGGYKLLAGRHRDADGCVPQHTWFYRYDYPNPGCLQALSECTFRGFGEVEFHLHHGHDTAHSLAARLQTGLDWFSSFGALNTAEAVPRRRFGYVAGNSALDNGAGDDALSGCDTELSVLREAGCYADFTFPSIGSPAQPRQTNSIYYAREDGRPRSYDTGVPVRVGGQPQGDLMIFQGPSSIDWEGGLVDDGSLENTSPAHPRRLASWLAGHVHVVGRPEWVFVKLTTHAMQNRASFLSAATDEMFSAMEYFWNKPPFRLHYVTAREAYNIVKAAEAGYAGNPNDYRDFEVPPPANRLVSADVPWRLRSRQPGQLVVEVLGEGPVQMELADGPEVTLWGGLREVEVHSEGNELKAVRITGNGPFEVQHDGSSLLPSGANWWLPVPEQSPRRLDWLVSAGANPVLDKNRRPA